VRPAGAADAAGSPIFLFAMDGWCDRRGAVASPPPLRLRYGVDVDSTRLEEAHGLFSRADSLSQILHRFIRSVIIGNKATANQSPLPRLCL